MAYKYNLYPEAERRLKESGLVKRIDEILKSDKRDDLPLHLGFISKLDIPGYIDDMKERGYLKNIPKSLSSDYKGKIDKFFRKMGDLEWRIEGPNETEERKTDYEELLLISSYIASSVLDVDEFWKFDKFGFDLCYDFFGSVGVYLKEKSRMHFREGYKWETRLDDCSIFVSEVSGSEHGDFRLFRTDLTPYETLDPVGNKVNFRPISGEDENWVAGYHSVEPSLLAGILKYWEQEKIQSELLKNNGAKLIKEFKGIPHAFGPFADAGYDAFGPRFHLSAFDNPIPEINNNLIQKETPFNIGTEHGGWYGIYIGEEKELIFYHFFRDDKGERGKTSLIIPSNELDHLIKGLFVQAQRGLGRTSIKQLVDVIEYRFSEKFVKDKEESMKMLEEMRKKSKEQIRK